MSMEGSETMLIFDRSLSHNILRGLLKQHAARFRSGNAETAQNQSLRRRQERNVEALNKEGLASTSKESCIL